MSTNREHNTGLYEAFASMWLNRQLIFQLTKREVIGRYRGSIFGVVWSFLNPILMLVVYTVFFSVIFKSRWGTGSDENQVNFAIVLFVGLIVHGFFAECINRAPILIRANVNYVKKIIFPLDILPCVAILSALFHAGISFIVLLVAQILLTHSISWTLIFFPLVISPFVIITLGFLWILAATGVYIRDISQVTGMITSVLLFMSPVFYPISSLPARLQPYLMMNPLTFIIEQSRNVLIYSQQPNWLGIMIYLLISLTVAWAGFWYFQRFRKGFADVL